MKAWLAALLIASGASPIAASAAGSPVRTETAIRALRAQSNAALARHDFNAMRQLYLPDYTILPGSSGAPFDVEGFGKRISTAFAEPTFVTYVRTPVRITMGFTGKRAAETGRWVGTWHEADGEMRVSGVYQAMWQPTAAGWRLKNESFVTLDCTGSKRCPEMD